MWSQVAARLAALGLALGLWREFRLECKARSPLEPLPEPFEDKVSVAGLFHCHIDWDRTRQITFDFEIWEPIRPLYHHDGRMARARSVVWLSHLMLR